LRKLRYCLLLGTLLLSSGSAWAQAGVRLVYVDFPPYEQSKDGEPSGVLVEIVRTLFSRAGVPLTLHHFPFKRGYELVRRGNYDGIFNFYRIESRLALFDYSRPITRHPLVLFVKKDSDMVFSHLPDLRGKTIGTMIGYTYGQAFDQAEFFRKDPASEHVHSFRKLLGGRIDAYLCDRMVGLYTARSHGFMQALKSLEKPVEVLEGHIGFTRGKHRDVIAGIDRQIVLMKESGEIDRMIGTLSESPGRESAQAGSPGGDVAGTVSGRPAGSSP
jgi:polar amino acid transport system substrate-binding protein